MRKGLIVFLVILIVAEVAALGFSYTQNDLPVRSVPVGSVRGPEALAEKEYWTNMIDVLGAEKGYQEFKKEYSGLNFGDQHMAAHIVGALLYKKAGIGGLTVCDSDFAFGCYHSFFGQVLADKGTQVIAQLDQECLNKFGLYGPGCQHGIGHGIMEFFGSTRLVEGLDACEPTTQISNIAGCTSGIFMEYFVPIIITDVDATSTAREMDPNNPYDQCPTLPEHYRESCYYSIGQWWNQTPYYRNEWKKQGELCKNAPDTNASEECYLGIGNIVGPSGNFTPEFAVNACKLMPDKEAEITCRAGASWSFDAMPEYKYLAPQICADLNGADRSHCIHKANVLDLPV